MTTPPWDEADERWMDRAMGLARLAAQRREVPIGCVIVLDGQQIASSHDGKELFKDPTAHAEILALRAASRRHGDWRLDNADLYVTLEPCAMCAGAIIHARIRRLIFAAHNPRWGVISSGLRILDNPTFNHSVEIISGVREAESAKLLRDSFKAYRTSGI